MKLPSAFINLYLKYIAGDNKHDINHIVILKINIIIILMLYLLTSLNILI